MEFLDLILFFFLQTSGEFSAASPERLSVSSTIAGGKRLPYSSDINQSRKYPYYLAITLRS